MEFPCCEGVAEEIQWGIWVRVLKRGEKRDTLIGYRDSVVMLTEYWRMISGLLKLMRFLELKEVPHFFLVMYHAFMVRLMHEI